ncbi:C45 family autoproteolytic acyltransferase/hydrolase [Virgibacillus kekensis]|uniref:C45 family autoproteolytic acyltransferase/hydrolase n=1 Tax=Virgibacillus kekensis TaxID=202261 RepID=A0ABV9DL17_9BACI
MKVYSDVTQFRGSHFDFGYAQGRYLRESNVLINRQKGWKTRKPRFYTNVQEAKQAYMRFTPGIWDELLGLQEALELPMEEILRNFGNYRVNAKPGGCSILTGTDFMVRNYDYNPITYDGRYSFFQPTDQGYAMMGPASRVTGRMDGMNEKGLSMGYNFMQRRRPGDGFICYMIGRIILETCATVDDAIQLLKEIPHRGSFSYVVMDPSGESYVVETTARSVGVRESNICTNHFEILTHENRYNLDDSLRRKNLIEKNGKPDITAGEAFCLMNDTKRDIFSKLYGSWAGTIHTAAYFPKELKAWFSLGGDQDPIVFDFGDWLKGNDIEVEKITGELDSEIELANM